MSESFDPDTGEILPADEDTAPQDTARETHLMVISAAEGTREWSDEAPGTEAAAEPQARHRTVYEFFEKVYSPYYELRDTNPGAMNRDRPALVWCPQWWLHPSVVGRMVAAWYAWEEAYNTGGAAMSSWILEHADRHFDRIMAEDGPFKKCKTGHTEDLGEYPTDPCPEPLRIQDTEQERENQ